MTKEQVTQFLRENEWARTIRRKNEAIAIILQDKPINKDTITNILAIDRYFRLAKRENPELDADKNTDNRIVAEQQFEQSIGYEDGFFTKIKQAKML